MIQSTSNSTPRPGGIAPTDSRLPAKPASVPDNRDTLDTTATDALRQALAAQPEIRSEVVENGQKLVVDPNYPPRAIIEDLARLFVNSQDPSDQN